MSRTDVEVMAAWSRVAALSFLLAACAAPPGRREPTAVFGPPGSLGASLAFEPPVAREPHPGSAEAPWPGRVLQETEEPGEKPSSKSFSAGVGLTDDPDTLLTVIGMGFDLRPDLALAPMLQLGLDDHETLIAPTIGFEATLPLEGIDPLILRAMAGVGVIYLEEERRSGDDDDLAFLLNFGLGADVVLSEGLSVGTRLLINVIPQEVLDEHTIVSWEVVGLRFRF